MATMLSNCRSTFGITCVQCHEELIAPDKSEYRVGMHIRHVWCSDSVAMGAIADTADAHSKRRF
jgi:hypothetical protein